jgi:RND superfamily putative drug exporter
MSMMSSMILGAARAFGFRKMFARLVANPPRSGGLPSPGAATRRRYRVVESEIAGRATLTIGPKDEAGVRGRMLWFHGGAYCVEANSGHLAMARAFADRGIALTLFDYPLAPEHGVEATVAAAYEAWKEFSRQGSGSLGGDSAGGGLALAVAMRARSEAAAAPDSLALFSPWVDAADDYASCPEAVARDPLLTPEVLAAAAARYARGAGVADPRMSPLRGDVTGLPRIAAFVSTSECLLGQCRALAERVKVSGGSIELREYEAQLHDWPLFPGAESDDAIARAAELVTRGRA